jgi:hypothetical protein
MSTGAATTRVRVSGTSTVRVTTGVTRACTWSTQYSYMYYVRVLGIEGGKRRRKERRVAALLVPILPVVVLVHGACVWYRSHSTGTLAVRKRNTLIRTTSSIRAVDFAVCRCEQFPTAVTQQSRLSFNRVQ